MDEKKVIILKCNICNSNKIRQNEVITEFKSSNSEGNTYSSINMNHITHFYAKDHYHEYTNIQFTCENNHNFSILLEKEGDNTVIRY